MSAMFRGILDLSKSTSVFSKTSELFSLKKETGAREETPLWEKPKNRYTTILINAGVRFCHPDTIFTLYKSIVLPKLTYGLELCYLNATPS